jgi:hypothetical protein
MSSQSVLTPTLRFPAAICRPRANAEFGFLIVSRGINLHPANARSCDIGFPQGPTWFAVEFLSVCLSLPSTSDRQLPIAAGQTPTNLIALLTKMARTTYISSETKKAKNKNLSPPDCSNQNTCQV